MLKIGRSGWRSASAGLLLGGALIAAMAASATSVVAQEAAAPAGTPIAAPPEIFGAPGSPSATRTIDGMVIPNPAQPFSGTIKLNAAQSTPAWPARQVAPPGAPNVLVVLTDDTGYGAGSTFGGVIPMPTLDALAETGLRYTNFNSTALCSPSRAALLTGRNHHNVGFGNIAEAATGFPGYDAQIGRDSVAIGAILRANGYNTSWYGKNHNTPPYTESQVGPFDQWPTGEIFGFDHFYGFMGGDANQWQPNLFNDTTQIYPFIDKPGWNLITAEADDAIRHIETINSVDPDKPFFVYLAPGATHAPHHPTKEWVDRISALHLFDDGWNKLRDTIFANQKRLGVIPPDAQLTPWPDQLKQWDTVTADEKKLFIRQADVYAAYLAYADNETGRVIDAIREMGKLDNTLIIYIVGDNGSSAEGSPIGTPNEVAQFNGITPPVADQLNISTTPGVRIRPTTIWRSAGPGPSTRRSSGPSRSPHISAASARVW